MTDELANLRAADHADALEAAPWRVVEGQHVISTRRLVDSDQEQMVLEEVLERSKPPLPVPDDPPEERPVSLADLHYLLVTAFRYPPLRHGSRFGSRAEPSLWYGSEALPTAVAEHAYYQFYFLEGTAAVLPRRRFDLTAFQARIATRRGVDLTRPPFDGHVDRISSPSSYAVAQGLGSRLREAGVEAIRYRSARDPGGGSNMALFTPFCFTEPRPVAEETWSCVVEERVVEVSRIRPLERPADRPSLRFARELFEIDGALPEPAP